MISGILFRMRASGHGVSDGPMGQASAMARLMS